jgi:cytochrome P450
MCKLIYIGDQFAMMEATATLALIMQKFDMTLATPASHVGMRTGIYLFLFLFCQFVQKYML